MNMHGFAGLVVAFSACVCSAAVEPLPPIRTLLITGHNNHNWQYTSRVHQETLESTGRFAVDITNTPETLLAGAGALAPYGLIVLDFNNDPQYPGRWPAEAEKNFVEAVRGGAGVVAIHAANNAFKGWTEYEQMLGLMWRDGTGHGKFHEFAINLVDPDHPITKGLADFSTSDELYHKLVNSQKAEFHLLAQAMSATEFGGTGQNEPMALTLQLGKGRVFATPLGHVWANDDTGKPSVLNAGFRSMLARGAEWAATGAVTLPVEWRDGREHNRLTAAEKTGGWSLLFDGLAADGMRGFKQAGFPEKGWSVVDGTLRRAAGAGGGDLCTKGEFADFEFACDWRATPGANSGIIYRCTEDHANSWETGREMQVLDDLSHADGKKPKTRAGTMYDLFACTADVCRPAGEWNHARVVCRGTHIEHWLNGFKVVDVDTAGEAYAQALAESKFVSMPDFGKAMKGHIALQDHGDEVWFRDIKVREIK